MIKPTQRVYTTCANASADTVQLKFVEQVDETRSLRNEAFSFGNSSVDSLAPIPFDKLTAAGSAVTSLNYASLLRISFVREEKYKSRGEKERQRRRNPCWAREKERKRRARGEAERESEERHNALSFQRARCILSCTPRDEESRDFAVSDTSSFVVVVVVEERTGRSWNGTVYLFIGYNCPLFSRLIDRTFLFFFSLFLSFHSTTYVSMSKWSTVLRSHSKRNACIDDTCIAASTMLNPSEFSSSRPPLAGLAKSLEYIVFILGCLIRS